MWNILLKAPHALNNYSNVVLVLITAAYVWLTWHSLKAFQESTLRDREARRSMFPCAHFLQQDASDLQHLRNVRVPPG
jgi:hypothetical protein